MSGAQRHFLIWLSETEQLCGALDEVGRARGEEPATALVIEALRAAHRKAERAGGMTVFRFCVPAGAEGLVASAAIRIRSRPLDM